MTSLERALVVFSETKSAIKRADELIDKASKYTQSNGLNAILESTAKFRVRLLEELEQLDEIIRANGG
jgi:hypothetical protein